MTDQSSNFITLHSSFTSLIGAQPSLRLLCRTKDGLALFHEAGIYLPARNVVVLSSNRIHEKNNVDQTVYIVHVPLDAIPCHENPLTVEEQNSFFQRLQIEQQRGPHLFMPNGATRWKIDEDEQEEGVLWCEQGTHLRKDDAHSALVSYRVRNEKDKTRIIVDKTSSGARFSSLNDVVVHPTSKHVFFTDPPYGVEQLFKRKEDAYATNGLYRWRPEDDHVELVDEKYVKVNGCTFISDPRAPFDQRGRGLLITTDTGRFGFERTEKENGTVFAQFVEYPNHPACIYAYPVNYGVDENASSSSSSSKCSVNVEKRMLVAHSTNGVPDGIHPDDLGNVWAGHGDGVHVYSIDWDAARRFDTKNAIGTLIGKIRLPTQHGVANFCWAGNVGTTTNKYRLLLFAEDELWEAVIAVNGSD